MADAAWWSRVGAVVARSLAFSPLVLASTLSAHAQAPEDEAQRETAPPVTTPAPAPPLTPSEPFDTDAPREVSPPPPAASLPPADDPLLAPEPSGPVDPAVPDGKTPLPEGYYGRYGPDAGSLEINALRRGSREHEGFFLRLTVGVGAVLNGYREAVDGYDASDVTTRALAGLFSASVGGRVVGNLMVHGDFMASAYGAAKRRIDGTTDARDRIDGSLGLLGAGVTYYFMPTNAYLTGVLGIARFAERRDGEDAILSNTGVGMALLIGKEWWVGRSGEWGMGGALRTMFVSAPVDIAGTESRLNALDIGIVFGTTYN